MTAQENDQGQNVAKGQFVLRRAFRETAWPVIKVGTVVAVSYGALNTPWVKNYVEDLSTNPKSVHFGHMVVASLLVLIGMGLFLTRLSSLSGGVKLGIWVAIALPIAVVNGWWLNTIYSESIDGSSALTAAFNTITIGVAVVVVATGIYFVRRAISASD